MSGQDVADRLAIRELIERYSDAITRRAWDDMGATYHEDGVWTCAAPMNLELRTRAVIQETIGAGLADYDLVVQMTHSIVIDLQGDKATARTVLNETSRNSKANTGLFLLGIYNDRLSRRNGRWGFDHRVFKPVFMDREPPRGMAVMDHLTGA
jgi:hypothetical protein